MRLAGYDGRVSDTFEDKHNSEAKLDRCRELVIGDGGVYKAELVSWLCSVVALSESYRPRGHWLVITCWLSTLQTVKLSATATSLTSPLPCTLQTLKLSVTATSLTNATNCQTVCHSYFSD